MEFGTQFIQNDAPDWGWNPRWRYYGDLSSPTDFSIHERGEIIAPITSGRHLCRVTHFVRYHYGELIVGGATVRSHPFYIK